VQRQQEPTRNLWQRVKAVKNCNCVCGCILLFFLIPAAKGTSSSSSSSSKETNNNENENESTSTSDKEKQTWSPIYETKYIINKRNEKGMNSTVLSYLYLVLASSLRLCWLVVGAYRRTPAVQKNPGNRQPCRRTSETAQPFYTSKKRPKISHTVSWKGACLCIASVEIALPHLFMAWRCNHS